MIINKGPHGTYTLKENRNLFYYPGEWEKLMKIAKPRQKMTLDIQLNTGARHNEMFHITPKDVDFSRQNIVLRVTKTRAKLGEKRPTPRIIPVSSPFCDRLKKYIKLHKVQDDERIPSLSLNGYNSCIKYLTKKIGREDYTEFSSHNVRKTFENWMLAVGVEFNKLCLHMGHDSKTAMKHYVSPDIFTYDDKTRIRKLMGDLYSYNGRGF